MLVTLPDRTLVLVDSQMLPRYWAAVWSLFNAGGLAPSTHKRKLSHIEALYVQAENAGVCLDDLIQRLDLDGLGNALEAFFISLRNVPDPSSQALARWNGAFHFVRDACERIARKPGTKLRMNEVQEKIASLDRLYLGLRPQRRRMSTTVRALPKDVVHELLDMVKPRAPANPFEKESTQWRMYCLVVLLLFQGLRRSEALVLRADSLETQGDPVSGERRWLLRVPLNEDECDPRAQVPSIKTADSIRSLPVTKLTAEIVQNYLENYRGKANHGYLLSSIRNQPLSIEGVNKAFHRLTDGLSVDARRSLLKSTGADSLTPHALRHTCAVLRMKQMLRMGHSPEQAMSNLRSFFGWSKTSVMPLHYAKAALDERLNETWNDRLDERLEFLRGLPQ
jgi:integrase